MTQRQLQALWLRALLFTLMGYALLGKGFAYLFIGELVFVIGLLILLQSGRVMLAFSDSVLLLWTAFAFWGFCQTIPYLSRYRFDAVRDAVLWAYGAFALMIAAFFNSSSQVSHALNAYRKYLRWYLPALPILLLLSGAFRDKMPKIPWAPDISIVYLKAADAAVHLGAAALFLLIFPDSRSGNAKQGISVYRLVGLVGWFLSAIYVLVRTRGGFLAMTVPIIIATLLKGSKLGWKVVALAVTAIVFILLVMETGLITMKISGRAFTTDQITNNIASITGGDNQGNQSGSLQDTKIWRLMWWRKIIDYTIFGPYFWTGKGFGVNLATVDGPREFSHQEASALRSPHNGSMSVLARMGVPGILAWLTLNFVYAVRLFRAYRRAVRSGSQFWSRVDLWIFCYWLSALINSSFDVYLEGPQGGIWFWSIIGFGVAAMRIQAFEARQLLTQPTSRIEKESDADYVEVHA